MNIQPLTRLVDRVWQSIPTLEGAGVNLKRAFGFQETPLLDPFLLLDDFRSENPADFKSGFPWHPHRGIETVTYVLDGDVEHGDSMGHKGNISAGDVQWMTAGSGIVHQEMPIGNSKGQMLGFQLWANLPAHSKMVSPRYRAIKQNKIPLVTTQEGAKVRIICGKIGAVSGPVTEIAIDPEYLDVEIAAGKSFTHLVDPEYTVFAYVIDGEAYFEPSQILAGEDEQKEQNVCQLEPQLFGNGNLVLYKKGGSLITVTTGSRGVRFLLVSGKPLREPVAWTGPIVMNSQEQLRQAFQEYRDGTFIKTA